jgi:Protein of unknown function (DUF616)
MANIGYGALGKKMVMNDVVYTALFGRYENLNEISHKRSSSTRYICFTDNPNLTSTSWEIVVQKDFVDNPIINSRRVKFLGHEHFPIGTRTLYIDNTVKLLVDGSQILDDWLNGSNLTFMSHYSRKNLRNEFLVCSVYDKDSQDILFKQFKSYCSQFPGIMNESIYWGGMIAKINCEEVSKFMTVWFQEFLIFSKRDQLSLKIGLRKSPIRHHVLKESNCDSQWHIWPVHNNRIGFSDLTKTQIYKRRLKYLLNGMRFGIRFYFPIRGNFRSNFR